MNNLVSMPEGLGVKERLMYRAIMNDPAGNLEKRWRYNKTQDLVGIKKTDSMSGEVKVSFDKAKRLDIAFRADAVVDKEKKVEAVDENIVTKEMLIRKRLDLDMDIQIAEKKKAMVEMMLKEFFE